MMEQLAAKGFYDIYPVHFVPFWRTTWFLIIISTLAVCALSVAIFLLWRWWSARRIPTTAWDEALIHLAALESRMDDQQVRLFYQELTRILKNYLSKRYDLVLAHKTDKELAYFMLSAAVPDEIKQTMHTLFKESVTLKFAAYKFWTREAMMIDLQKTIQAIKVTQPEQNSI